jgi:hypothetical protein
MVFMLGRSYSRREISDVLGGELRSILPEKDGRILCGCFKKIPEKNPGAPEEVTTGSERGRINYTKAEMAASQADPIPIFIFQKNAAWTYVGRYRCRGFETATELLRRKMAENPARGVITGVLYFERVGD